VLNESKIVVSQKLIKGSNWYYPDARMTLD